MNTALQYSPERLLQLARSRGSKSSIAASANLLQDYAQGSLAEILVRADDGSSMSSRASSRLSAHSSSSEDDQGDQEEEEEEEEGVEWVYGEVALRTDLPASLVDQIRKAVHLALEEKPSDQPADSYPPPAPTVPKPAAVLVSTNATDGHHPLPVYDHSSHARVHHQRRANPGGFFGRPRCGPAAPVTGSMQIPTTNATAANHGNAERDSWRSSLRARRIEPTRIPKEADTISWRRMEPGAQWVWHENTGYVMVKA